MGNDCTLKLKGIELPDVNDARAIHEGQQVTTSRHQVTRLLTARQIKQPHNVKGLLFPFKQRLFNLHRQVDLTRKIDTKPLCSQGCR